MLINNTKIKSTAYDISSALVSFISKNLSETVNKDTKSAHYKVNSRYSLVAMPF